MLKRRKNVIVIDLSGAFNYLSKKYLETGKEHSNKKL